MKNSTVQEYNRIRKNLERSIASYRKKGYDVNFKLPKQPKKITAASLRNLEKAAKEYKYMASHSTDAESIYQQRRTTAGLDREDRIAFLDKARDMYGTYNLRPEQIDEVLDNIGVGDDVGKAWEDLEKLIDKVEASVTAAKGKSGSQNKYFNSVKQAAQIARGYFRDLGFEEPKLQRVIRVNLKSHYEDVQAILENFMWHDSDQEPDMELLSLIKEILLANPFKNNRSARESKTQDDVRKTAQFFMDKKQAKKEAFLAQVEADRKAKRERKKMNATMDEKKAVSDMIGGVKSNL